MRLPILQTELKKRRHEKEQRIRLALMGLAPQSAAGKSEAKVDEVKRQDVTKDVRNICII